MRKDNRKNETFKYIGYNLSNKKNFLDDIPFYQISGFVLNFYALEKINTSK